MRPAIFIVTFLTLTLLSILCQAQDYRVGEGECTKNQRVRQPGS